MANLVNRRLVANTLAVFAVGGMGTYTASNYFTKNDFAESPNSEPHKVFGRGPAFKSLRLHSSERVNHNTKRLRLELPGGGRSISGVGLTSALLTFSKPEGSWLPVVRPYTPVSKLDEPAFIDLLVKQYPNGKATSSSSHPSPAFAWTPNKFYHVYLIAGGAGITPIYQLAQGFLENPADKTKITVIFGVNTEEGLLLRTEFDAYKRAYPDRIDVYYTVSRPGSEFKPVPGVRSGFVTKEVLAEVMRGPEEADTKIFVCGPPAMETALVGDGVGKGQPGILKQLGYSQDRINKF
ncbi:hypothetical protein BDW66DRAFT_153791 [Aspergillus desertorum]